METNLMASSATLTWRDRINANCSLYGSGDISSVYKSTRTG